MRGYAENNKALRKAFVLSYVAIHDGNNFNPNWGVSPVFFETRTTSDPFPMYGVAPYIEGEEGNYGIPLDIKKAAARIAWMVVHNPEEYNRDLQWEVSWDWYNESGIKTLFLTNHNPSVKY